MRSSVHCQCRAAATYATSRAWPASPTCAAYAAFAPKPALPFLPAFPMLNKTPAPPGSSKRSWWREPLLHFAMVGALLFALDRQLTTRQPDARTIVVDAGVAEVVKKSFRSAKQRDPSAQEMPALIERWIEDEVVFREGLALGVDQGDATIRERVIGKSLLVLDTTLTTPQPDDARLRQWFETQRARYDEPQRFDFEEFELDTPTLARAEALVKTLNSTRPPAQDAARRSFLGQPMNTLTSSYGAGFAQALGAGQPGVWQVLTATQGPRVARLLAIRPAKAATYDTLRDTVAQDWGDAMRTELRAQAVSQRARKYRVKFELAAP